MNKINKLTIASLLTLLLLGCSNKKEDTEPSKIDTSDLTVCCPIGAPAMALYNRLFSDKVEINAPSNVETWFSEGKSDIIFAPTNAGINFINKKSANYKIAATVTFGNFYLASTGNDSDGLDKDDYVVIFQKGNIPDKLFQYIYGNDYNAHYVADNAAAIRCLVSGKDESNNNASVDYVLVAQPGLYRGLEKNNNATLYSDLQSEYKKKSNNEEITQASIFINNDLALDKANAFLDEIESDVKALLADPNTVVDNVFGDIEDVQLSAKLSVGKEDLKASIKDGSMGLGYKKTKENKEAIDKFLTNLSLGNETSEEIYF